MSELGIFIMFIVSVLMLAPVIIASILFSTVVFVDVSDTLLCLTTTTVKNSRIAAPATKTNIQLNCISNAFLFIVLEKLWLIFINQLHWLSKTWLPLPSSLKLILLPTALMQSTSGSTDMFPA